MFLVDAATAETYLRQQHRLSPQDSVRVEPLTGGVSNVVLRVIPRAGAPFILKQARQQLRVPQPWFCSVDRILREIDVLQVYQQVLNREMQQQSKEGAKDRPTLLSPPRGREGSGSYFLDDPKQAGGALPLRFSTPQLLFQDRENYLYAMSDASPGHHVWKQQLLDNDCRVEIAQACGRMLAAAHAATWRDESLRRDFADRTFFHDLRVDPYYREIARRDKSLQSPIDAIIDSLENNCVALVHGDFSPKNLLILNDQVMLVDFEVGHYGDPAFDLGFFMSHLALKTFRAAPGHQPMLGLLTSFWTSYDVRLRRDVPHQECESLQQRAIGNLAACGLARIAGKSQVEYLTDPPLRLRVADFFRGLMFQRPSGMRDALERLRQSLSVGLE